MKFILMGLVKSFTKEMGRSPNIGELKLLRREADIIEQQDKIIPFPSGGKDKVNAFKPRPKPETEAEMLERMKRQNKESVERLKNKKEKDLSEKLKDFDGDPDAMAMGGLAGLLGEEPRTDLQAGGRIGFKKGSKKSFGSKAKDFLLGNPDAIKFFGGLDAMDQIHLLLGLPGLYADGGRAGMAKGGLANLLGE